MIRAAILDDRPADMADILGIARKFAATLPYPLVLETFSSPYDLLEAVEEKGGFDVYFLDVIMPLMTGIEVAERLRRRGERCEIVFLTTSREYGVDAFDVRAAGYLVKPVSEQRFFELCGRIFAGLSAGDRPPLFIRTNGGGRRVSVGEIVMIESFNHIREVRLENGQSVPTPMTLAEFAKLLKGYPEFYSPHRSYIVNLDYVFGIQNNALLIGGTSILIAKNAGKKFREYYMKYCFGK